MCVLTLSDLSRQLKGLWELFNQGGRKRVLKVGTRRDRVGDAVSDIRCSHPEGYLP